MVQPPASLVEVQALQMSYNRWQYPERTGSGQGLCRVRLGAELPGDSTLPAVRVRSSADAQLLLGSGSWS